MKLLFIQSFIEHDFSKIYIKLEIMTALWIFVGIAIIIDLISGIKKAKRIGNARTSIGFRRTVKKANQYGVILTFSFLFDIILSIWFYIPFSTAITCGFLVFIEAKSVWENMEKIDQESYKTKAKDFIELFQSLKEEDQSKLLEVIKNKLNEPSNTNN
jgi:phage-related holin